MATVTVTITREVLGEQVTFTATGDSDTDATRKETMLEVAADVRQAVNEYLDTIAAATPIDESEVDNGTGTYSWESVVSMVRNVTGGQNRVKVMTTKNKKWGVPLYPEVLQQQLQKQPEDVPTEAVDMPGWLVRVHYVDGKPKRVVQFKRND